MVSTTQLPFQLNKLIAHGCHVIKMINNGMTRKATLVVKYGRAAVLPDGVVNEPGFVLADEEFGLADVVVGDDI